MRRRRSETFGAIAAYTLLTLVLTWPLARGLTRDVPGDFGDPLLNTWILAWDADHLARAFSGHPGALRDYWQANVFAPHPIALAYSEHLTAQALQMLPVYVISGNPILGYNLLFLSTFILSAFGMFLLVRELTGNSGAAFAAGLAFGFAPYRIASVPHLQVLSSAWMPFTLYAFRRFFATGRLVPLAGAAAAWIAQNLSCGYYLLFFSPVAALYVAWELTTRQLWTDTRTLLRVTAAVAIVLAATAPFLWPYLELRRLGFSPRSLAETSKFSADVYGFFTADPGLRLWGSIARAWPTPEAALFPGLTVAFLAVVAVVHTWRRARRDAPSGPTYVAGVLGFLLAVASIVAVALLLGWSIRIPSTRPVFKITSLYRALMFAGAIGAMLLAASGNARTTLRRVCSSPAGFFAVVTVMAAVLALGPEIYARGRVVEEQAPYAALYRYVPGFDGLRVPARFGMIVALGLAVLAGWGATVVGRRRHRRWIVAAASVLIVAESWAAPIAINGNDTNYKQHGLAPLPDALAFGASAAPVYRFVAQLPPTSVLLELPLGEPAFDVRHMFNAIPHKRALVNGYSGGAPIEYLLLSESLKDALTRPDQAWLAVVSSGATHAIVHEGQYEPGRGARMSAWLTAHGAHEIATFGEDRVFALP
jgi:hypothetical protein